MTEHSLNKQKRQANDRVASSRRLEKEDYSILFFGNCQAETLAVLYRSFVAPRTGYKAHYVPNFSELIEAKEELFREADIIVDQKMEFQARASWSHIPNRAKIVPIPLISGGFLWPYSGQPHPGNVSLSYLAFGPFGFEISDGYLNRLYQAKMPADKAFSQYAALDIDKMVNLDRLLELHLERQRQRDELTGFQIADYIEENFQKEQLFHTPFHMNLSLLKEFTAQFLTKVHATEDEIALMRRALTRGAHRRMFNASVYEFELPVHPAVAEHYRLQWASPERKYYYFCESGITFEEYTKRYVSCSWNEDLFDGVHHVHQGEDEQAWLKLRAGLERDPLSAEGHHALSLLLNRRADRSGAVAAARRACELIPDDPYYQVILGDMLYRAGDTEGALDAQRRALELYPGNPDYGFQLGLALKRLGRQEEAIEVLRRTLMFAPYSANLYLELARLEYETGNIAAAEDIARKAVELQPDSPVMLVLLAELLAHSNQLEEALRLVDRGLSLEPEDALLRERKGWLLWRAGALAEAADEYREAIRLRPDAAHLHEALATIVGGLGLNDEAADALAHAVECEPGNLHWRLRAANLLSGLKRFDDAEAILLTAAAAFPDDARTLVALSRLHHGRGDLQIAITEAQRAVELASGDGDAHQQLGHLLLQTGNAPGAKDALSTAVQLKPHDPGVCELLGEALSQLDRWDDAIAAMRDATNREPRNPHWRARLGLFLLRAQRFEDAEAVVEQAQQTFGHVPFLANLLAEIAAQKSRI